MSAGSLTCLGVGDGRPCADRFHSSYLYRFGRTHLLVDCGEGVCRTLTGRRVPADRIDRILLSHLHSDHLGGLFMLLQGFWLAPRRKDLTIHLPVDGIEPVRRLLEAAMIFDEKLGYRQRFEALAAGKPLKIGGVTVTPFPTTHLERTRRAHQRRHPLRYDAFSFLLETPRLRIGHSADLGEPPDLTPLVAQPLDLLVCELAHFTPAALFSYLRDKPVRRLVLIHLGDRLWRNPKPVLDLAKRKLGPMEVTIAREGMEIAL